MNIDSIDSVKGIIKSYGIILYTIFNGKIYYFISKRRSTVHYSSFIFGNYNKEEIINIFNNITEKEKVNIQTQNFKELWDGFFINCSKSFYKKVFLKANNKFLEIKPYIKLLFRLLKYLNYNNNLDIITTNSKLWEFPKGRKNNEKEEDINAALREFKEEVNIILSKDIINRNCIFIELYMGTDKQIYSNTFYLVNYNKFIYPRYRYRNSLSSEMETCRWVTLEESKNFLSESKYKLLKSIERRIKS